MIKHSKGFTLLELLIALVIFTIVSVMLVSIMHSVLTIQKETYDKSIIMAELQTLYLLLSRDISQIVDRPVMAANGSVNRAVGGDSDFIEMTHGGFHNPQGQLQHATLQRTAYRLEHHALIRESYEVLDASAKSLPHRRVILKNVEDFRLEYLDQEQRFHYRWPDEAKKQITLPRAVRVTIQIAQMGRLRQLFVVPATPEGGGV